MQSLPKTLLKDRSIFPQFSLKAGNFLHGYICYIRLIWQLNIKHWTKLFTNVRMAYSYSEQTFQANQGEAILLALSSNIQLNLWKFGPILNYNSLLSWYRDFNRQSIQRSNDQWKRFSGWAIRSRGGGLAARIQAGLLAWNCGWREKAFYA